jgi:tetratricopeptide (TPR) repeat protein
MRYKTFWLLFLIACYAWFPVIIYGAENPLQSRIVAARSLADRGVVRSDKTILLKACAELEQLAHITQQKQAHNEYLYAVYYLTYVQHWLVLQGRGSNDEALLSLYLPKAVAGAEELVRLRPDWAEGHLLLSTMYGIKLSQNLTALFSLGPLIERHLQRASELAPNNPRVLYVQASAYFVKPGIAGGSTKKAVEFWQKAAHIFEQERREGDRSQRLEPSWGYCETLAGLGRGFEALGAMQQALGAYRTALIVEPEYKWVKDELLPQLEERIQRSR